MKRLTRRTLLISGALLGGGFALGVVFCPDRLSRRGAAGDGFALATWLRIHPDNTVIVVVPHVEMGQGTHTTLAMMLVEELDAVWEQVRVEQAPAQDMFATGDVVRAFLLGERAFSPGVARPLDMAAFQMAALADLQLTGGSLSVRSTGRLGMRRAGAAARIMLLEAAAERWGVTVDACHTEAGTVYYAATARSATYGELAQAAALRSLPVSARLKPRSAYRLCGSSPQLLHARPAITGSLVYGCDAAPPGLRHAAIRHAPAFGAAIASVDKGAMGASRGILDVVQVPGAVAVVADSYWQAESVLAALALQYSAAESPAPDDAVLDAEFDRLLGTARPSTDFEQGDVDKAEELSGRQVEQVYAVPFLAHATLEPMNCTAWWHDGRLELWTGTQDPLGTRAVAAQAAGISAAAVTVHALHIGGGFGRRTPGSFDYVEDAVHVAQRVPYPVRVQWSREEDVRHDRYRPAGKALFRAALGSDGRPVSWRNVYTDIGYSQDRAAAFIPYDIAHQRIGRVTHEVNVPLGYWRSVEHSSQGFFMESFVDELARAAGMDPLVFRLRLLARQPRFRAALQRAADMIGWGRSVPAGSGLGLAIKESFGTIVAQAAEVTVVGDGVRVARICAAVDAGEVVHPANARAQVEGGILFGLGAALKGRISMVDGAVVQGNFHDYPVLTMAEAPDIDIAFLASGGPMGGMGEVGVPPVAAAVCNAIAVACGARLRRLPIAGQPLAC